MTRLPSPHRPRRRQRSVLSLALLRALLALALLALFGGVCVATLADITHAVQVLTIVSTSGSSASESVSEASTGWCLARLQVSEGLAGLGEFAAHAYALEEIDSFSKGFAGSREITTENVETGIQNLCICYSTSNGILI